MSTQGQWRWCRHCECLHFAGHFASRGDAIVTGACPGSPNGHHGVAGSGHYTLVLNDPMARGQTGWQRCRLCEGMFFFGSPPDVSGCLRPRDGMHDPSEEESYTLVLDDERAPGQTGWRWCNLCHALFFGVSGTGSCAGRPRDRPDDGHVVGGGVYNVLLDQSRSEIVSDNAGILAVHAALLCNSTEAAVVYFSGNNYASSETPIDRRDINHTRVWRAGAPPTIHVVEPPPFRHDLFCCGQALLSDGRLLAAGGTAENRRPEGAAHAHHWPGQAAASIFDPAGGPDGGGAWSPLSSGMARGRWYPTLLSLGQSVLAMGGHPESGADVHSNTMVEEWRESSRKWHHIGDEPDVVVRAIEFDTRPDPFTQGENPHAQPGGWPEQYPRLHLLPDGRVVVVRLTGQGGDRTWIMDGSGSELRWTDLCAAPLDVIPDQGKGTYSSGYFYLGSTVLLPLVPPDYRVRILSVGERDPLVLDLGQRGTSTSATWSRNGAGIREWLNRPGNRAPRRHHCNATLLPDGTVLVLGGADNPGFALSVSDNVAEAELFDPFSGTWQTLEPLLAPRNYHTSALLLPDGRVWIAGSSPDARRQDWPASIEAYSPPYLRRGKRPRLGLPAHISVGHDDNVVIPTPDAASATRVTLVRCGSVTHGFNSDQRHVQMQLVGRTDTTLTVRIPASDIAPHGWYMLFLINSYGVPSFAAMAKLG